MGYEQFQGSGSIKREVNQLTRQIEAGEIPDVGEMVRQGETKQVKHAFMKALGRQLTRPLQQPALPYLSQLRANFIAWLGKWKHSEALQPSVVVEGWRMPAGNYTPAVRNVLTLSYARLQNFYTTHPFDPRVSGMRQYFMEANRQLRVDDSYANATLRGEHSAEKHIGAVVNFALNTNPGLPVPECRRMLANSYGTAVSPFMNINQEYFGRLLEEDCNLYQTLYFADGNAPTLNPDYFYIGNLGESNEPAVNVRWDKLGEVDVRLGRFTSMGDLMLPLGKLDVKQKTAGCPYHDLVSFIYPDIVNAVIAQGRPLVQAFEE